MAPRGLHLWADVLQQLIEARCRHFTRVFVLNETDSTQDAAERLQAVSGEVVIAGRQTAGRGRLGRVWADTEDHGIALTCVLDSETAGSPERLAVVSAVGVARAVETLIDRAVGIKWPNDVLVDGRKLSGILIERQRGIYRVGIGINVTQSRWPTDLAGQAVSLRECDASCDRLAVLESLISALDAVLDDADASLRDDFAARDVLRGDTARFVCDNRAVIGRVVDVDPWHGLRVRTDDGRIETLPAATTRVLDQQKRGMFHD